MKILHVISGLETGGTELFLERLLQTTDTSEFESSVVSLGQIGPVGERLRTRGISVDALEAGFSPSGVAALSKIGKVARRHAPDLIQGWMYHGNLGASLARRMGGATCPVVWNIRHSLDDWRAESAGLHAVIRLGGRFSTSAARILFNSASAARQHERLGYESRKAVVIPNGFDCGKFHPDSGARLSVRAELGLGRDSLLIGRLARYHPMKDHTSFLQAATHVAMRWSQAHFLMAGTGVDSDNAEIMTQVSDMELIGRVHLLGARRDMPRLTAALDVACSSSAWGEAFPNVLGEAMACGVPCVTTDVGASAELVGETGRVVPSRSPEALAAALLDMLASGEVARRALGAAARERVLAHYELGSVIARYVDFYRTLLAGSGN